MPGFFGRGSTARRYCRTCRRHVLAAEPDFPVAGHGVLTALTCGLWLPALVLHALWHTVTAEYVCPRCGRAC